MNGQLVPGLETVGWFSGDKAEVETNISEGSGRVTSMFWWEWILWILEELDHWPCMSTCDVGVDIISTTIC